MAKDNIDIEEAIGFLAFMNQEIYNIKITNQGIMNLINFLSEEDRKKVIDSYNKIITEFKIMQEICNESCEQGLEKWTKIN